MRSFAVAALLLLGVRASTADAQIDVRAVVSLLMPPPPPMPREFRGVWVATVGNRDWPSQPGLPVERQKAELLRILETARRMRMNAVVFQVRPAADALYESKLEPWSEFLTGTMGRAPEPRWDPLAFAIQEAHQRGLELHAWFNPFRARYYNSARKPAAPSHISRQHPELVRKYGPFLWQDPGSAEVRAHALRVISDVVKRYDVDGIHIDDYFYPYLERNPRTGKYINFPDERTYRGYVNRGGKLSRADWRRSNIDRFVEALYRSVKELKPWVKVGISPFGIWRPGHPESVVGLDSYTEIFADSRKWLNNGWLDYVVPQLYWRHDSPQQSYVELLNWWVQENQHYRHVWAGNAPYRVNGENPWPFEEIVDQVRLTRAQPGATGNVYFSMNTFMRTPDLTNLIVDQVYARAAIPPESRWLDTIPPNPPIATLAPDSLAAPVIRLQSDGGDPVFWWAVRVRYGVEWTTEVLPGARTEFLPQPGSEGQPADEVAITAVDRNGLESRVVRLTLR
jgi:uncharacterized lipoprotein YddW (UPF0748 family)